MNVSMKKIAGLSLGLGLAFTATGCGVSLKGQAICEKVDSCNDKLDEEACVTAMDELATDLAEASGDTCGDLIKAIEAHMTCVVDNAKCQDGDIDVESCNSTSGAIEDVSEKADFDCSMSADDAAAQFLVALTKGF